MQKILALTPVLIISLFSNAYAEEPLMIEQLSPSGKVLLKLEWQEVYPNDNYTFKVFFHDPVTREILDELKISYNFSVMYNDHHVEFYEYILATDGTGEFDVSFPEESHGLATVVVKLKAANDRGHTISYSEDVIFSINLVPEFGIIPVYTPPEQVAQGIEPEKILCKDGLELIIKNNESPACVKPETVKKLKDRDWSIMSPIKQIAQGIEPEKIICKDGLGLIIKHNFSPACVKLETAVNLQERGWGVISLLKLEQGIDSDGKICKDGLELIIKHNFSLVCVSLETAEKLEESGWGIIMKYLN